MPLPSYCPRFYSIILIVEGYNYSFFLRPNTLSRRSYPNNNNNNSQQPSGQKQKHENIEAQIRTTLRKATRNKHKRDKNVSNNFLGHIISR